MHAMHAMHAVHAAHACIIHMHAAHAVHSLSCMQSLPNTHNTAFERIRQQADHSMQHNATQSEVSGEEGEEQNKARGIS